MLKDVEKWANRLEVFEKPSTIYDLHKKAGLSYLGSKKVVQRLEVERLIRMARTEPFKATRKRFYVLTEPGVSALENLRKVLKNE